MTYTYTKHYPATDNDIFKDTNWAYDHFGPSAGTDNPAGRWDSQIGPFIKGQWTLTYTFKHAEDHALFVLSRCS